MRFFFPLALRDKPLGYAEVRVHNATNEAVDWGEPFPLERFAFEQALLSYGTLFPKEHCSIAMAWEPHPLETPQNSEQSSSWYGASATLICLLALAAKVTPFRFPRKYVWASGILGRQGEVSAPSQLAEKLGLFLQENQDRLEDAVFYIPATGQLQIQKALKEKEKEVVSFFWPRQAEEISALQRKEKKETRAVVIFFVEAQLGQLIDDLRGTTQEKKEQRRFFSRGWVRFLLAWFFLYLVLLSFSFFSYDACQAIWRPLWPNLTLSRVEQCKRRVLVAQTCGNFCDERCRFFRSLGRYPKDCFERCELPTLAVMCSDQSPSQERCGETEILQMADRLKYLKGSNKAKFPPTNPIEREKVVEQICKEATMRAEVYRRKK